MDLKGKRIILASNSPRRKELLSGLNIDFEIDTENYFEESFGPEVPYGEVPRRMAEGKSHGFHRRKQISQIQISILIRT